MAARWRRRALRAQRGHATGWRPAAGSDRDLLGRAGSAASSAAAGTYAIRPSWSSELTMPDTRSRTRSRGKRERERRAGVETERVGEARARPLPRRARQAAAGDQRRRLEIV